MGGFLFLFLVSEGDASTHVFPVFFPSGAGGPESTVSNTELSELFSPSLSSREGAQWVPLSLLLVRTHWVLRRTHRLCRRTQWALSSETGCFGEELENLLTKQKSLYIYTHKGKFHLGFPSRSALNRRVFKTQTQLNRQCLHFINCSVLVPLSWVSYWQLRALETVLGAGEDNKTCAFEGGGALGAERKIVQKRCFFSWQTPRQ